MKKCIFGGCKTSTEHSSKLCEDHRNWKRDKMHGTLVTMEACQNCQEPTVKGRQCFRCGHLNIQIGLHK